MNAYSTSPHIVTGGSPLAYVGSNSANPFQGVVRINGSNMEVFDGSYWKHIDTTVSVGLSGTAGSAIDWAIKRMEEERQWAELAKENKAVKIALENLEQARQQLAVTAKLAREYDTETTN
jgi:hypothetical protein